MSVTPASKRDDERQRLQTQYTEIATLAGGLAHEIRNPLSTIGLNLELLLEEFEGSDSPKDRRICGKLQTVQKECQHLNDILNAFLQFARAGELEKEPTDLSRFVEEFIEFYRPQAQDQQIEISPHLAADLPPVLIDPSLMRQVLMNLALNAQQAMPKGGRLELQTNCKGGRVDLEIIDSGMGMSPATLARIFQVYFSTKQDGSGLGLPTVRKIVEAHQGTITCESELGKGTRFVISLPVATPPAENVECRNPNVE
ncbi:MAG: ATP-binding protein [Planctomycetaceae bacterium]